MRKKIVKPKKVYVRGVDKSEAEKVLNSVKKKGKKVVEVPVKPKRGRPKKADKDLKVIEDKRGRPKKQVSEDVSYEIEYSPSESRKLREVDEIVEKAIEKSLKRLEKIGRPRNPKISVKKKALAKVKPKTKPKPMKMSDKQKELMAERKAQEDIFDAILEHLDSNENFIVLDSDLVNMVAVIVKSIELKVNRVSNQDGFQPYETNDVNKYCVLSIVCVEDIARIYQDLDTLSLATRESFIDSLVAIGCPVLKINRIEDVAKVLGGIGSK
jgi:hypothetical protein